MVSPVLGELHLLNLLQTCLFIYDLYFVKRLYTKQRGATQDDVLVNLPKHLCAVECLFVRCLLDPCGSLASHDIKLNTIWNEKAKQ